MLAILKTKDLTFGEVVIKIRELSALQYLDQQEYVGNLERPAELSGDESEQELDRIGRAWSRLTLNGHSRLVAYSFSEPCDDIDALQLQVQQSYTFSDIKKLHNEVAELSGFGFASVESSDEKSEESSDSEAETSPK